MFVWHLEKEMSRTQVFFWMNTGTKIYLRLGCKRAKKGKQNKTRPQTQTANRISSRYRCFAIFFYVLLIPNLSNYFVFAINLHCHLWNYRLDVTSFSIAWIHIHFSKVSLHRRPPAIIVRRRPGLVCCQFISFIPVSLSFNLCRSLPVCLCLYQYASGFLVCL